MFPFAVQLIDRSLYLLVWTSLVDDAHEQISDCERLHRAFDRLHIPYETGVILKALYGEGNHRNLWVAGLLWLTVALILVFTLAGIWAANRLEAAWGEDPSRVVVDEMVGVRRMRRWLLIWIKVWV